MIPARISIAARCAGARTVEHPGLLTAPGAGLRVRDMRSARPRIYAVSIRGRYTSVWPAQTGWTVGFVNESLEISGGGRSATVGAVSHSHPAVSETTGPIFKIQTAFDSTAGVL